MKHVTNVTNAAHAHFEFNYVNLSLTLQIGSSETQTQGMHREGEMLIQVRRRAYGGSSVQGVEVGREGPA